MTSSCFVHHVILSYSIQTLTTLDLSRNEIEAQGAQYLAEALRQNRVRSWLLLASFIMPFFPIRYRHSLHYTLDGIKSELKVHNIWMTWKYRIARSIYLGDLIDIIGRLLFALKIFYHFFVWEPWISLSIRK